jgi:CheY-like chemotaxis protein
MVTAHRFKGRILIVDDCPTNLLITAEMFNELGLDTQRAENGAEAVEKFHAMKVQRPTHEPVYHIVLMDHQMPVVDGPQATQMIRVIEQEEGLPMTPIIGLSGKTASHEKAVFLAAGLTDWKPKPTQLAEWLALCQLFCSPGHSGDLAA